MFLRQEIKPEKRFEDFSMTTSPVILDSPEAESTRQAIERLLVEIRDLLMKARYMGILQKLKLHDNGIESHLVAKMLPPHDTPGEVTIGADMDTPVTILFVKPPSENPSLGLVMNQGKDRKFVGLWGGTFCCNKARLYGPFVHLTPDQVLGGGDNVVSFSRGTIKKNSQKPIEIFLREFHQKLTAIIEEALDFKQLQIEARLGVLQTLPFWL